MVSLHPRWPKIAPRSDPNQQVSPQPMPSRLHIAFDRLHVTPGWPKLAPRWPHEMPSWHQDRPICAQVGAKMGEVGPKPVQSRTDMAPGGLKFASSWPQYCIKADISQTYIKHTNSQGKTMIFRFPHAQFASKMAQDRSKIRSKSTSYPPADAKSSSHRF